MHISLYVKNIYQTADFYSKFFGQDPDKVKPDYCKFTLENPSLIISFVLNEEKVSDQFGHLGFQVDSLEELKTRMDDMNLQNIDILEEMGTNCCYANQDKFWVTDPNGYMWEVYYFHKDVTWNDPRYQTQEAVACCTPETTVAEKPKVALADLNEGQCTPESGCC
ncbi:MAG: VOC family protein [Flavobacteriales bacterium]|nr:VOC family protein [Flavobacteriales bacterium]